MSDVILITIKSVDGHTRRRKYKTIENARKFAHEAVGPHPDLGFQYAVSNDGVCIVLVQGATLQQIFPEEG